MEMENMAENFQLYNKDFINDFRELLKQLLASGDHSDITLVSDDLIPFEAHKLVICSQSLVLKKGCLIFTREQSFTFPQRDKFKRHK